ncbi:MAG TPA: aldolase/citrate lyase family protein [Sphaerochaeta sp.]|nr:aldolase/citrate lyase family protein [Sphaerochaeta sp.]
MTRTHLLEGKSAVGTMIRIIRTPAVVLVAKSAGLDFVMFDMEHGPVGLETISDAASLARSEGIDCFVRVPELTKGYVSRALDCGVTGVMVPMIRNGEEAYQFAQWAKYQPIGNRGLGGWGAHTNYRDSSAMGEAFLREENERILTIAQIECSEAITNIDDIAGIDGIDALLIGPVDLSNSLGVGGQLSHPKMEEAITLVCEAAKRHNKVFGMHSGAALLHSWIPRGCQLRMSSMDIELLYEGMRAITALKE